MPLARQRQWRIQNQYQSLNEYNNLKSNCPEGIYLTPTPGNFALWSGVIFVREGPYAPGILRFQIAFPQQYPAVPPLIVFTSDIFHPLITPLTTYTYSTATPASVTVSSGDDERLLPGGLSLRHGFPKWFDWARSGSRSSPRLGSGSGGERGLATDSMRTIFKDIGSGRDSPSMPAQSDKSNRPGHQRRPLSFHIPPPKEDVIDEDDIAPSIIQVLHYLKRVFEDESLLDDMPLDMAANTGAWYAWRAHRRKTSKPLPRLPAEQQGHKRTPDRGLLSNSPLPQHGRSQSVNAAGLGLLSTPPVKSLQQQQQPVQNTQQKKSMADWNWDGVWLERVKKGISTSLSDAVLYGNAESADDMIHFLDVDDEEYANFRESILPTTWRVDREIGRHHKPE